MPSLKTPAPKPQWATLQAMAIRYQALVDGPLDDPERVALRAQIASHLMGGVVRCLVSDDEPDADAPARFERVDSQMVKLIGAELKRYRQQTGGLGGLAEVHGGEREFAPVVAQAVLLDRQLRAERADLLAHIDRRQQARAPRRATMIEALLRGYDGRGSLEGFMRDCVRSALADMAEARRLLVERQRERGARIPKGATPEEKARLQSLFEQRQAVLCGEAPPFEELGAVEVDTQADETAEAEDAVAAQAQQGVLEMLDDARAKLGPLEQALLDQALGRTEPEEGKALAARFNCSPARVSQLRTGLLARLALLMDGARPDA